MRIPDEDTGRAVSFSNANGVSFGSGGNTVTASVGTGVRFGQIAAGTQTAATGTVLFSNSNNFTFGMSGSSRITASVSNTGGFGQVRWAAGGVTQGLADSIVLSNSNGITFGMAGSQTITASFGTFTSLSRINNIIGNPSALGVATTDQVMFVAPMMAAGPFPALFQYGTMFLGLDGGAAQTTAQGTINVSVGLYTLNSQTLSLLNSASTAITYAAVSDNSTAFRGDRWLSLHWTQFATQPMSFSQTDYWLAGIFQSSGATQSLAWIGESLWDSGNRFGTLGVNATASQSSCLAAPFCGYYSASTNAFPVSIGNNDLSVGSLPGNWKFVLESQNSSF